MPPKGKATPEQRAAMKAASEKLDKIDPARAKAYADQWVKQEPRKRMTGKQMPRAEQAVPSAEALNKNTMKTIEKLQSTYKRAYYAPAASTGLHRAYVAKEVADKAVKIGMNTATAAAVAATLALTS